MRKLLTYILLVLLTVPVPLTVFAQDEEVLGEEQVQEETSTIVVYARTLEGDMIQGINISVKSDSYDQAKNTDVQGKAVFADLAAADYTVSINLTEGSLYTLAAGELASKPRTLAAGEQSEVYFGVKLKNIDEGKDEEVPEEVEIELPSSFHLPTSTTTELKGSTADDLKAVRNFTLHVPDVAKIVYNETLDLSNEDTIKKLNKLDQYVFLDHPGEVSIATDLIPELDKPATITLYGLSFVSLGNDYQPTIVKDDQDAGDAVKNVTLTGSAAISFDVESFSTYAVRPTLKFDQTDYEVNETNHEIKGMVDDLNSEVTIYLNDEKLTKVVDINDDGSFVIPVDLVGGENVVQVIATGISEQSATESLTITNTSPDAPQAEKESTDMSLILGLLLILGGVGLGVGYLVKTKKIKLFNKKNKQVVTPNRQFDHRLLTPEERVEYGTEEEKPVLRPKM